MKRVPPRPLRLLPRRASMLVLLVSAAPHARAQESVPPATTPRTLTACYDPSVGALYLIRLPGLGDRCLKPTHHEVALVGTTGDNVLPATSPTGPAGGDLGGTYPNPSVTKLQGSAVATTVPVSGQALFFTSGAWRPATPAFNGDVTGGINTLKVVKIQNQGVSATVPADGQVLQWNSGTTLWTPTTIAVGGVTDHSQLTGLGNDDHGQYLLTSGVRNTSGIALTGTLNVGNAPISGPGVRLLWYPKKAALRTGQVWGTEWDDANVGYWSVATGVGTKATGDASTAFGQNSTATSVSAFASGSSALASGENAHAFGQSAQATGSNSTAIGTITQATGSYSFAVGYGSKATADRAVAIGYNAEAKGDLSVALGSFSTATGTNGIAIGFGVQASGTSSMALGTNAWTFGKEGSFVWGDNAPANPLTATADNEFAIRASGGIRLRTEPGLTTGCDLAAGSGSWNCTSSRDVKTDFADVNGDEVLAKLRDIPVQTWRYRSEPTAQHMGPFAEDFRRAFHLGTDARSIGVLDIAGVNLAAVKALDARTSALQAEVAELRRALAERDAELRRLQQAVIEITKRE